MALTQNGERHDFLLRRNRRIVRKGEGRKETELGTEAYAG